VIDHGLGLYTFYGHLESIAVRVGDTVEAGDPLGRVGATGRVTRAHLHWAVRINEARVNPLELVKFAL
jgi:murein DD-endopeptidase MepM/ murein hydrolase activator NlpD